MLTVVSEVTATVVAWNDAELWPAGIVTVTGTFRMPTVDCRLTVVAVSTGPARLTAAVNDWPPVTVAGTFVNDARPGSMVTGSDALTPSTVATSVVCTGLVTFAVLTSTYALLSP